MDDDFPFPGGVFSGSSCSFSGGITVSPKHKASLPLAPALLQAMAPASPPPLHGLLTWRPPDSCCWWWWCEAKAVPIEKGVGALTKKGGKTFYHS